MSSPAARILDLLQRPRQNRPGSWVAACPCCESRKGRPLAITEKDDGRVLLYAFCGCSTEDVLGRIGLTINDLFDKPLAHVQSSPAAAMSARDLLNVLSEETSLIAVLAAQMVDGKHITEADFARLATAAQRVWNARDHING
jgi:hypothetical protein